MRQTLTCPVDKETQLPVIHRNLQNFSVYCILNSNSTEQSKADIYSNYELLAGIDVVESMPESKNSFDALQQFHTRTKDWIFGYFSYDLKNEIENLKSENPDRINFPSVHFFRPKFVLKIKEGILELDFLADHTSKEEAQSFLEKLLLPIDNLTCRQEIVHAVNHIDKDKYIKTINKIQEHIQRGDIYEMNFCNEFFAENVKIDPIAVYNRINELSPMPFSAFYRLNHHYAICASPERFLAKRGDKIISQPIKGTARRGKNEEEDKKIIENLFLDPKERSENVMIVDLVRNDLSRTAQKGSVQVEELFGISSFRRLHQMISTITSLKRKEVPFTEVIRAAFPMGSMTGAPKVRAMQLIEEFEESKRGLYSGSIGYIDPNGDFDFNVVIRSILYNEKKSRISYTVGSAITANADPEKEYYECLLKAESMQEALNASTGKSEENN